jgi:hypothetical protein
MRLLYYNHHEGRCPIDAALQHACGRFGMCRIDLEDGCPSNCLSEAGIGVFHEFPTCWYKDTRRSLRDVLRDRSAISCDGFVAIQISSGHLPGGVEGIAYAKACGASGSRYLVCVEDTVGVGLTGDTAAARERWRAFFDLVLAARSTLGQLSAAEGKVYLENTLDTFIRTPREQVLPALAILCQGYLAVMFCDPSSATDTCVIEALKKMGWVKLVGEGLLAKLGLKPSVRGNRDAVSKHDWWTKVFGEPDSEPDRKQWLQSLRGDFEREIGEARLRLDSGPVWELWEEVFAQQHPPTPALVAAAYRALADGLATGA